ncbi:MAG: F0F1 ATP synthase subunit C, partial [Paracoccus sp. BP8]
MENLGQLGQYLGAGLACVGMAGAAMGVGNV